MRQFILVLLISLLVVACNSESQESSATATVSFVVPTALPEIATPTPAPILLDVTEEAAASPFTTLTLTNFNPEPVLQRGASAWDTRGIVPGGVVYHDGLFHMIFNVVFTGPAGYAISTDGLTWERVSDDPVLSFDDIPFPASYGFIASGLVRADDGTWLLFFSNAPGSQSFMGRATADDPAGPWTVDAEPIWTPAAATEWDALGQYIPEVVKMAAGYHMYYTGVRDNDIAIGRATSPDGVTWTRYDDPATTEAPYAESDPVFGHELTAEQIAAATDIIGVANPQLVQLEDGTWLMGYQLIGVEEQEGYYYSLSEDGIAWEAAANPVFKMGDFPALIDSDLAELAYHEGIFYLYLNGYIEGQGQLTDIYVITSTE